jgi:membrane protein
MLSWIRQHVWQPLQETWDRFVTDDGTLMAAAVAYYVSLSLFPLLLVLVSGIGWFLETTELGRSAQQEVLNAIARQTSGETQAALRGMLERVNENKAVGGPLGMLGMLAVAIAIFAQFETAFDRIWNVRPPPSQGVTAAVRRVLFERFRAFLLLLSLGLVLIAVFLAAMTISAIRGLVARWLEVPATIWTLVEIGAALVLNTAAFTLLYRLLPKVPVKWWYAFRGAAVAAVGWEIGRQGLALWLVRTDYGSAYGIIGSFLGIMLWLYFASVVVFLGAEYIQAVCVRCEPERG